MGLWKKLRARIRELEEENERLRRQLLEERRREAQWQNLFAYDGKPQRGEGVYGRD